MQADLLDGLVVSGGDDIHPSLYGGEAAGKAVYDIARDELETRFIQFAGLKQLPILGICRGYQLINVTYGGSLYPDIRSMRKRNLYTILPRKKIRISSDSTLFQLFRKSAVRINALHHQAVHHLGDGFRKIAVDTDDIVQSIENPHNPDLLGVQWHPEYLFYIPSHRRIFHWLVQRSRKKLHR